MHTAALSDVGDQQDLTEHPAMRLEPEDQERTSGSLQQEKYIDLEMYNKKYYTCDSDSDSEGLFALTDFNDGEDWNGDPHDCVHLCKVKVPADESAME